MLDQMQVSTPVVSLSVLLEHPEFQQGLADAREQFLGDYEPAPLTEEEMIEEVEMNLSRRVTDRSKKLCRLYADEPSSYFYNLGYVFDHQ
jgi:hypothetical protein